MIRRRSGSGIIGRAAQTAARTALVAGVATAVSGKVASRHGANAASDAAPPAELPPAAISVEAMDQLKKLAELHTAGVLTDEEFAAQKARILG
jgi:hypothetical protein